MGAALLRTPDKLVNILTSLVTQVGEPFNIPISVKIRLLETETETLDLVKRLVTTGIKLLTIHCRTTPMRPREPSIRTSLKKIVDVCHSADVMCFLNGDVEKYSELDGLIEKYGIDGAMMARSAEQNASCFNPDGMVPWDQIVREYFDICQEYDNHVVNTKFCLARMIPGKSPLYQKVAQSKSMDQIKEALATIDEETVKKYEHVFKSSLTMAREAEERQKALELKEASEGLKRKRESSDDEAVKKMHLEPELGKEPKPRYLAV